MYPDLEPWQRDELEVWHRGWITKMMTGDATSEEYNAAIPPHPDPHHPEDDDCLLYTSPSPRDLSTSRMPSSA